MLEYNIVYILTNPIFVFAIFKLYRTFYDELATSKGIEKVSYFLYFILVSVVVLVTRIPIINLILNAIFLLVISLNYKSSFQRKIIIPSLVLSILFAIEITVSVAIGYIDISAVNDSSFNSAVGLILIRVMTLIVAYLINKLMKTRNNNLKIPKIYYLAFTIIQMGSLYLYVASLESRNLSIQKILISGVILIIINMTMILIDEKIYHSIIIKSEKQMLKEQNIAYENQIKLMDQSTKALKALKHDMKNHLTVLRDIYSKEKSEESEVYFEKIINEIEGKEFSQSGNFIIDSMINFKLGQLRNNGIQVSLDVNVPQELNISTYDLTVILGNLLDNAITAIKKADKKLLDLNISCSMGNLIIIIKNTHNNILEIENNELSTTKKDKENHGIGIPSIKKSLENYDGEIIIEYTETVFSVSVIIPYIN
jgi:signal transduction histidine kinase